MTRIILLLLLACGITFLFIQYPYALQGQSEQIRFIYFAVVLVIIVLGARLKRWQRPGTGKNILIWLGLFALVILAYGFRDELSHSRFVAELMPQHIQVQNNGEMTLRASENGHFFLRARVNDIPVRFMLDTGASDIVLSPYDAKRIGFMTDSLDYSRLYSTANGSGAGAKVILNELEIGNLKLSNVSAAVNKTDMDVSLLGMSFLQRLKGFRVEGSTLILIP